MDRPFVHVSFDEGSQLINLNQIVRLLVTTDDGQDELVLFMSDKSEHHIRGKDGIMKLLKLLCHYAVNIEGKPMDLKMDEDPMKALSESAKLDSGRT